MRIAIWEFNKSIKLLDFLKKSLPMNDMKVNQEIGGFEEIGDIVFDTVKSLDHNYLVRVRGDNMTPMQYFAHLNEDGEVIRDWR